MFYFFKEGSFIANNTIIINIFCNHNGLHQTSNDFLGVAFSGLRGEELFPIVSAVWGHCEVSLCHDMHLTLTCRLTCSIFLWPASKTVVPDFFSSGYSGLYHQPPIWQGFFALLRLLRKFQYENLLWSDSDIRTHLTISNHFIIIPLALHFFLWWSIGQEISEFRLLPWI